MYSYITMVACFRSKYVYTLYVLNKLYLASSSTTYTIMLCTMQQTIRVIYMSHDPHHCTYL